MRLPQLNVLLLICALALSACAANSPRASSCPELTPLVPVPPMTPDFETKMRLFLFEKQPEPMPSFVISTPATPVDR